MKKHRLLIVLTFALLLCLPTFSPVYSSSHSHELSTVYVGTTTTGKFHYSGCRYVAKIRSDHRVYFDSRDEAIDAGYVPCKVCRP